MVISSNGDVSEDAPPPPGYAGRYPLFAPTRNCRHRASFGSCNQPHDCCRPQTSNPDSTRLLYGIVGLDPMPTSDTKSNLSDPYPPRYNHTCLIVGNGQHESKYNSSFSMPLIRSPQRCLEMVRNIETPQITSGGQPETAPEVSDITSPSSGSGYAGVKTTTHKTDYGSSILTKFCKFDLELFLQLFPREVIRLLNPHQTTTRFKHFRHAFCCFRISDF